MLRHGRPSTIPLRAAAGVVLTLACAFLTAASPLLAAPASLRATGAGGSIGVDPRGSGVEPAPPTCYRGTNFSTFTAPPDAPDAGTQYPRSGPCRMFVRSPAGPPRGAVIQIAGGGWFSSPATLDQPEFTRLARVFVEAGFQVVTVEHTAGSFAAPEAAGHYGGTAYKNVVQWYDRTRYFTDIVFGRSFPVCLAGVSSSGHLALLADLVRTPDCVITEGAPTRLSGLRGSPRRAVARAFGTKNFGRWSPSHYGASAFRSPILMGQLTDDRLVSITQMTSFAAAHPNVTRFYATPTGGPSPPECSDAALALERVFGHLCQSGTPSGPRQGGITADSIGRWRTLEANFLLARVHR